ncbi:MAG: hypothetical protein MUE51_14285 [Thermoleophilia bacterium]|nr:hypothetical protein [Thermoleophilia bacterium]
MTPNPDLLRTEFLGLTVRYDDVVLPREDLAAFFAAVSERHSLTRMELHPEGGATFTGPDGGELVIRPGQAASGGVAHLGVDEAVERVAVLLGEAVERYGIGAFWIEDVTLVASWDTERDDGARRLIGEDLLGFDEERSAPVAGEDLAFGLRIWRRLGEGTVDVAIEPMHAEPGRLYLRVAYAQQDPVPDVAALVACIEQVAGFLRGPVRSLVLELARR